MFYILSLFSVRSVSCAANEVPEISYTQETDTNEFLDKSESNGVLVSKSKNNIIQSIIASGRDKLGSICETWRGLKNDFKSGAKAVDNVTSIRSRFAIANALLGPVGISVGFSFPMMNTLCANIGNTLGAYHRTLTKISTIGLTLGTYMVTTKSLQIASDVYKKTLSRGQLY